MNKGQVGRVGRGRVGLRGVSRSPCSRSIVHAADNARQIVDEAQKRTDAKSQRYEGLLQVFDAKGKISDKRWTMERLGRAWAEQGGAALHAAGGSQRRGAADRQPSRSRVGSVDVDAGDRARPADRAAGSLDAVLRHRLQLRGSRGARRQSVRLHAARRRHRRRRRVLEDSRRRRGRRSRRSTRGRSSGSARTTTPSRGSKTTSRIRRSVA